MGRREYLESLKKEKKKKKNTNYLKTRIYSNSDTSVMSCIMAPMPLIFFIYYE